MESQNGQGNLGLNVEYRVREIKRYIVTRYEYEVQHDPTPSKSGSTVLTGEYPNWDTAYAVGYALCKAEHERLGYEPGDMRIQYPVWAPNGAELSLCPEFHSTEEIVSHGRCFVNSEGDIESAA